VSEARAGLVSPADPLADTLFERAVSDCYREAGLREPQEVIWVPSPLVLCVAAPTAGLVIELARGGDRQPNNVESAVRTAIALSVESAVDWRIRERTTSTIGLLNTTLGLPSTVNSRADEAIRRAIVDSIVRFTTSSNPRSIVQVPTRPDLRSLVHWSVRAAVGAVTASAVDSALSAALGSAECSDLEVGRWDTDQVDPDMAKAISWAVGEVIREAWARFLLGGEVATWWWAHREFAMMSQLPRGQRLDEAGRLHAEHGPAIEFPDGWGPWYLQGIEVTEQIVKHPETLTIEQIEGERNVEVRRLMMERFGSERYLRESNAQLLHTDEFGKLWRTDVPGDEPLVVVEVVNSTPEPDGTFKDYFLRVPPTVRTAREAVAWTFDAREHAYVLEAQS
jgi:hypothetical protein